MLTHARYFVKPARFETVGFIKKEINVFYGVRKKGDKLLGWLWGWERQVWRKNGMEGTAWQGMSNCASMCDKDLKTVVNRGDCE